MTETLADYCRLCFESNSEFSEIFDNVEGQPLSNLIKVFCSVEVSKNDIFSKLICSSCLKVIVSMLNLRNTSRSNDFHLRQVKTEPEDEELIQEDVDYELNGVVVKQEYEIQESPMFDPTAKVKKVTKKKVKQEQSENLLVEIKTKKPKKKPLKIEEEEPEPEPAKRNRPKKRYARKLDYPPVENGHYKCHLCELAFELRLHLLGHLKIHADKVRNPFPCTKCKNAFRYRSDMTKHLKIHLMDSTASTKFEIGREDHPRICSACEKVFEKTSALEEHWDEHHEKSLNPYSCHYCCFRFKSTLDSVVHMKEHEEFTTDGVIVFLKNNKIAYFAKTNEKNLIKNGLPPHTSLEKTKVQKKVSESQFYKIKLNDEENSMHDETAENKTQEAEELTTSQAIEDEQDEQPIETEEDEI